MKKIIIIAAVIVSSAITAFAFSKKTDTKPANIIKIDKADFAGKSNSVSGAQLSSGD